MLRGEVRSGTSLALREGRTCAVDLNDVMGIDQSGERVPLRFDAVRRYIGSSPKVST
jgi:hypothetical protein